MTRSHIPAVLIALFAVAMFVFLVFIDDDLIVNLPGDSVTPERIKAGQRVTVTRSWRVERDANFVVNRTMVKGDCKASCEIVDLSTSLIALKAGDYLAVQREHIIPERASPGVWTLQFTWHWQDRLGRQRTLSLLPLKVVVE